MNETFVGVDVGTGSARAGVFDAEGRLVACARRPIAIWRESGDIFEHSSADIFAAACAAVRDAVGEAGILPHQVRGLGLDATCSLVALDACGRSLPVGVSGDGRRDTIVWMDHRAQGEAEEINAGEHEALRYAGGALSPEMQAPKLLWLARHRPDTFARAEFFDLTDYLTLRATGSRARSLCAVACKWPYLGHERRWSREFFDEIGLGALAEDDFARIGAKIVEPGSPLGDGLTPEAAAAMGLQPGTPVAAGLIDAHAGALATLGARGADGACDPTARLALILGTSGCCMTLTKAPLFLRSIWGPHYSALAPGLWVSEGGMSAFGAAIDRVLRLIPSEKNGADFAALEEDIVARAGSFSRAALLARDLHVLPDFLGNRSPYADSSARGGILGLDLAEGEESRRELYVACLCGLAQELSEIMGAMEAGGFAFDLLVASGGASRSALVRQIVADATGRRVASVETTEPVLLGAAMLGAVAAGRYSMPDVMAAMSRLAEIRQPAGGEIAVFHAKKRAAYETLRIAERRLRETMR